MIVNIHNSAKASGNTAPPAYDHVLNQSVTGHPALSARPSITVNIPTEKSYGDEKQRLLSPASSRRVTPAPQPNLTAAESGIASNKAISFLSSMFGALAVHDRQKHAHCAERRAARRERHAEKYRARSQRWEAKREQYALMGQTMKESWAGKQARKWARYEARCVRRMARAGHGHCGSRTRHEAMAGPSVPAGQRAMVEKETGY